MQKMRTPGDRVARQTRRRSAVWLVPNAESTERLTDGESQIIGALALDGATASAPDLAPVCVVIVEDAPHTARLLRRALSTDVMLIDASQPDMDGAKAYRQTRATPQTHASHVLFITAATALELSARGVDGGVLLRAPFEAEQVVALISELVGEH